MTKRPRFLSTRRLSVAYTPEDGPVVSLALGDPADPDRDYLLHLRPGDARRVAARLIAAADRADALLVADVEREAAS